MKFDFSKAFNTFLNQITENNFHVKDIEYPETLDDKDNCFITDFLDIEFHIEECPDWRFGIWMYISDKYNKKSTPSFVSGTFFGQHEETIDKFKPSHSAYQTQIEIANEKDCLDFFYHLIDILTFIKNEPMLAFYRDYTGCDYNLKVITRHQAKKEFKSYKRSTAKRNKFISKANKAIYSYVEKNILPYYEGAYIEEDEDCCPRYEIVAPYELNKEKLELDRPGCYSLDDTDVKELIVLNNKWEKKAKRAGIFYSFPFNFVIIFCK